MPFDVACNQWGRRAVPLRLDHTAHILITALCQACLEATEEQGRKDRQGVHANEFSIPQGDIIRAKYSRIHQHILLALCDLYGLF